MSITTLLFALRLYICILSDYIHSYGFEFSEKNNESDSFSQRMAWSTNGEASLVQ